MPRARPHAVLTILGASFVALAAAAALFGVLPADAVVRDTLLAWATPAVVGAMRLVNYGGDWRVLLPGTLVMVLVFRRARERWWIWLALMVTAPMAEGLLKLAIGRARPENASSGFPSGHATAAAAFCGAVLYLSAALPRRTRWLVRALALAGVVLVGLARVILRAHWPSDVLGGITLGLALASLAALIASTDGDTVENAPGVTAGG